MSPADYLRSSVERAKVRVKYCRAELDRFLKSSTDMGGEPEELQARRLRKLEQDLQRAEDDLRWAQAVFHRELTGAYL